AHEIRRHVRLEKVWILPVRSGRVLARGADLARDDVFDRALLVALQASLRKGGVQVRADRARRPCGGQRVAGRALRDEELLARVLVAVTNEPARSATGKQNGGADERKDAPQRPQDMQEVDRWRGASRPLPHESDRS